MWNKLTMAERAKYIQLAIQNGITDLNTIRRSYNSFARGGYTKWKEGIKEHKGIDVDNDSTYDYEGFYNSDPDRAWEMLDKDTNAHFIDEYKKAKLYAQQNNSMLIITGGSGFYLKSMLSGLSPKIEPLKIEISDDEIWNLVVEIDKEFCAKFSKNDKFLLFLDR